INKTNVVWLLFLALALTLLAACGSSQAPPPPAPLSTDNLNLIFVVSPDLAYQAPGDINPRTANLTNQGLQRSLLMATFLNQQVLGGKNVTGIYSLEPMTHLQTANDYPDMVGLETIQQFAMLNQITLSSDQEGGTPLANHSYPINDSYAEVPLPIGVVPPQQYCANCQGLDFRDQDGDNEALLTTIVKNNPPGFYVFSAPWENVSALMANINKLEHYNLALPASYISPNFIYAISITPSGSASLVTYDSHITPPATYPALSPPLASAACTAQTPFSITATRIRSSTGTTTTMSAPVNGARWIFPTPCSAKLMLTRYIRTTLLNSAQVRSYIRATVPSAPRETTTGRRLRPR